MLHIFWRKSTQKFILVWDLLGKGSELANGSLKFLSICHLRDKYHCNASMQFFTQFIKGILTIFYLNQAKKGFLLKNKIITSNSNFFTKKKRKLQWKYLEAFQYFLTLKLKHVFRLFFIREKHYHLQKRLNFSKLEDTEIFLLLLYTCVLSVMYCKFHGAFH